MANDALVLTALHTHGATRPCPRCGSEQWEVGSGRCNIFYNRHAPIPVYCLQCGFVVMHAPEELGLVEHETQLQQQIGRQWWRRLLPWKAKKRPEKTLLRQAIEDAVISGDYRKVKQLEEELAQCLKQLKK